MASDSKIKVEVVYALPQKQTLLALEVAVGTTVIEAVRASGILESYPEIDIANSKLGIFGRMAKADEVLQPGERVEIYRPLKADPKEVRRRLAAEGKQAKFLYTIPSFHNPAGVSQGQRRREEILAICQAAGTLVLEDDPYGLLGFDDEIPRAMRADDDEGRCAADRTRGRGAPAGDGVPGCRAGE